MVPSDTGPSGGATKNGVLASPGGIVNMAAALHGRAYPVTCAGLALRVLVPKDNCFGAVVAIGVPPPSTFLRPFAPRALPRFPATMNALTPARRLFGPHGRIMNTVLSTQVSLLRVIESSDHSISNHPSSSREFGPVFLPGLPHGTALRGPYPSGRWRQLGFAFS